MIHILCKSLVCGIVLLVHHVYNFVFLFYFDYITNFIFVFLWLFTNNRDWLRFLQNLSIILVIFSIFPSLLLIIKDIDLYSLHFSKITKLQFKSFYINLYRVVNLRHKKYYVKVSKTYLTFSFSVYVTSEFSPIPYGFGFVKGSKIQPKP